MTHIRVPEIGETIGHGLLETLCGYPIKLGSEIVERADWHLTVTRPEDIERYELVAGTAKTYCRTR